MTLLRSGWRCRISVRFLSDFVRPDSYLVIPGSLGRQVDTIVKPVIDTHQFGNIEKLQRNLDLRGIKLQALAVKETWNAYSELKQKVEEIEHQRKENTKKLEAFKVGKDFKTDPELIALRNRGITLRNDQKSLVKQLEHLEVPTLTKVLSLPNYLCEKEFDTVEFGTKPNIRPDHDRNVESGLTDKHPFFYFSKENALLELKLGNKLLNFLKLKKFGIVSPPDFVRSAVVEGCGLSYNEVFTLDEPDVTDPLRVVGGASLPGICTMFIRTVVRNDPPLRFCALGRRYTPSYGDVITDSAQRTCLQTLSLVTPELLENEVCEITQKFEQFYSSLGLHFRVSSAPLSELKCYEMSRIRFEMFSVSQDRYVEVGSVSKVGDYISRRLAMYFHPQGQRKFVNLVSATALDFQAFLHCWHENGRPELTSNV